MDKELLAIIDEVEEQEQSLEDIEYLQRLQHSHSLIKDAEDDFYTSGMYC